MNKSKKQPAREPIYFLDECLGQKKVYRILKENSFNVELHSSHFKPGTRDEDWLPVVGKNGWILITQDKRIRRHKNELSALRANKVCAFIISAKELRGEEIGELIVKAHVKIKRILKKNSPPIIAIINRHSVVELKTSKKKSVR